MKLMKLILSDSGSLFSVRSCAIDVLASVFAAAGNLLLAYIMFQLLLLPLDQFDLPYGVTIILFLVTIVLYLSQSVSTIIVGANAISYLIDRINYLKEVHNHEYRQFGTKV